MDDLMLDSLFTKAAAAVPLPAAFPLPKINGKSSSFSKRIWAIGGSALGAAAITFLAVFFALRPASSPQKHFVSTTASGNPSMAISEAIEYPESDEADSSGSYSINLMVANLYYGANYEGNISLLIGSPEDPGYDFESITVSLLDQSGESKLAYAVDTSDYAKKENGILLENAKKAAANDYHLSYAFDLGKLFEDDFSGKIIFKAIY